MRFATRPPLRLLPAVLVLAVSSVCLSQGTAGSAPPDSGAGPLPRPGSRVRLRATETGDMLLAGTVDALRGDSLVVRRVDGLPPLVVPIASLSHLDVHRDDPDRPRVITTLAVVGALGGAGWYVKWCVEHREACRDDGKGDPNDPADDSTAASLGAIMLLGGAVAGALVGQALTPGSWEPVGLPVKLGVVPWPGGGVGLVASFSFGPRPPAGDGEVSRSRGAGSSSAPSSAACRPGAPASRRD